MKRHHIWGALALLSILLLLYGLFSQSLGADEPDHERVELTGVHDRQQFAAGESVRIHDASFTDAFVAGREIRVERSQAEDFFAAAGTVRYRESVFDDLLTAGGAVTIDAEIRDDLIAAGGRISIEPGAAIGGDVLIAAGDLDLEGDIRGNIRAAAGRVTLSATVGGDVEVIAGKVFVDPGTRIAGTLIYRSDEPARIADQAVITGGVTHEPLPASGLSISAGIGIGLAVIVVVALSAMVLGVVLQVAVPGRLQGALASLRATPSKNWLLGFAILVATPIAANFLLVTLVGLPVGLLIHAAYLIALALGMVTAGYWLGSLFTRRATREAQPPSASKGTLRTATGMFLLVVLGLIPVIGWLALLVVVPLGVGAFVAANWKSLQGVNEDQLPPDRA